MRTTIHGTDLYFDTEGSELHAEGATLARRPAIVVLHGGPGFDQGYLRPGLAPLASDAHVVFVDLRGQGRSAQVPVESCTLEQMADDVHALCVSLGIERPIVLGHSAGGFVALQLALRHPTLAKALVLCSTAATLAPTGEPPDAPGLAERAGPEAAAVAQRVFAGDMSPANIEAFNQLVIPFYAGPDHMDVPVRILPLTGLNTQIAQYFFSKLAPLYDVRARLGAIAAPTLVVAGHWDWVCTPAAARQLAKGIAGAELVVLPGSGHFGFSEEPEAFFAAMRKFLARVATA